MGSNDISELLKLGIAERLAIAEELWASVASEREKLPAGEFEKVFIEKRLDEYLKNPSATIPWSEVRRNLGL